MNKCLLPFLLLGFFLHVPVDHLLAHDMDAGSGLSGTVLDREGKPLQNAVTVFFNTQGPPPDPSRHWRIPTGGRMIFEGGRFMVGLPAGHYYFGIIKTPSPEIGGQPVFDDWLYFSKDELGNPLTYQVKTGEVNDLGIITVSGPIVENPDVAGNESSVLQGKLTLSNGQPLPDFTVEAFSTEGGEEQLLFVSEKTTAMGEYRILLAPGSYRLKIEPMPNADGTAGKGQDLILPSKVTVTVQETEQQRLDLQAIKEKNDR